MNFEKEKQSHDYIALLLNWREGDALTFITWVEFFPFIEASIVEITGCMWFLFTSPPHPWALLSQIIIFAKAAITEITNNGKCHSCPGMFPAHNHLSCALIPAMTEAPCLQQGLTALLFKMPPINRTGRSLSVR